MPVASRKCCAAPQVVRAEGQRTRAEPKDHPFSKLQWKLRLSKPSIRACMGSSYLPPECHRLHLTDEKMEEERERDQQGTRTDPELPTGPAYPHCLSPTQDRGDPCDITPAFWGHRAPTANHFTDTETGSTPCWSYTMRYSRVLL